MSIYIVFDCVNICTGSLRKSVLKNTGNNVLGGLVREGMIYHVEQTQ